MLRAENITKFYQNHKAVNGVSIEVPEQSIFGLLGPNGAGKTTLIRIINQIITQDSGNIYLDDRILEPKDVEAIGYLPEERGLYKKMRVGEQAIYLAQLKGMPKYEAKKKLISWMEKFEIESWWSKKVEDLSKGMAQKIQFITTVIHEPKLLILDEPFSGFDPINANLIKNEILELRDKGSTIMLSTHNMKSVEEICDNISLINKGEVILSGSVKNVKNEHKQNIFEIQFKGAVMGFANSLWTGFELLDHTTDEDKITTARVKMLNNNTLNDLLRVVLDGVKVVSVKEIIPSMDDLFINLVNEKNLVHE
ncbi:MAG: ABC-2 type transport system ATP-binding protein [Patiriisocius sp.]|jgi:ABC-2 type transport system ATP-binding protein